MAAAGNEDKRINPKQEERRPNQQQGEQVAASKGAAQSAAAVGERATIVSLEALQKNNETAQHLWEASTRMFSELSKQSADHFSRSFERSGKEAQKALGASSANVQALLESADVFTKASEEASRQWITTFQEVVETRASHTDALAQCRTPQDLFTVELEIAREGLTALFRGTCALSELSARVSREAMTKVANGVQHP